MPAAKRRAIFLMLLLAGDVRAQPASTLTVLDVPFISQSEALCGGAAAAMVLRFWGERGIDAESFAPLVDRSAAGIRTDVLIADLQRRGWNATGVRGDPELLVGELTQRRPVMTLIEDRPGTFHYVVVVAATEKALVFHDPARAPFRVMVRSEFARRWDAAGRWMAVVVPGASRAAPGGGPDRAEAVPGEVVGSTPCERAIANGVRLAQENDLDAAERELGAALSCPGSGAVRELAGVRLLQRRWAEVAELASAAVAEDPSDAHAWRLLATSRFVQNDRGGALDAWNQIGEPRLDLVAVAGLTHTRQRVVERLIELQPGSLVTRGQLERAARNLAELPSAVVSRLEYVPVAGGLAEVRANIVERPLLPEGWVPLAAVGARVVVRRELHVSVGSLTGGGERIDASWRFWPNRPLLAVSSEAPAPWGGVWSAGLSSEEQPFTTTFDPADRLSARVSSARWLRSSVRVSAAGGADRWADRGTFGYASAGVQLAIDGTRGSVDLRASQWGGESKFTLVELGLIARTSTSRTGAVFVARGGASAATAGTPPDLWFGGDTGHARSVLLRAHPVLDDGRLRTERLGRQILFVSTEGQRWWPVRAGLAAGAAVFVDAALLNHRSVPGAVGDVDVGVGGRIALPGTGGVLRVDVAKGLRDGAMALSVAYEP